MSSVKSGVMRLKGKGDVGMDEGLTGLGSCLVGCDFLGAILPIPEREKDQEGRLRLDGLY